MKKLWGSLTFMALLYLALAMAGEGALSLGNHINMARLIGQLGFLCLGVGILIIAGGIDLSMGSFIALCGVVLAVGLSEGDQWYNGWHPVVGIAVVCAMGVVAGLIHGLLVTRFKLQAFIVTLCGLFIYRGLARWWADDKNAGLGSEAMGFSDVFNRWSLFSGTDAAGRATEGLPIVFVYLLVAAGCAWLLMHRSVYGRYLYAIGSNELAARYSGIAVDRYKILSYVICSLAAAAYAILKLAEIRSFPPSNAGATMELYAIAGAVLGGCSLRGGDGNVFGILVGTAILVMLPKAVSFWGIPDTLEYTVIGGALLIGAVLDETIRRRGAVRKI